MIKNILIWPDPALQKSSEKVEDIDSIRDLIQNMKDTLSSIGGIGLSAPQIGSLKRVCIVKCENKKDIVMINPEMIDGLGEITVIESCMSVPGEDIYKKRAPYICVKYRDESGTAYKRNFSMPESVIIQHEVDHLDGIAIADSLPHFERRRIQKRLESA